MKNSKLIWIPRILTILFILFISIFALDSFEGDAPFIEELGGFLIHLIPSFALIAITVVSWKYPLIGGCVFIVIGIAFTILFHAYIELPHFLFISLPPVLVGLMFIAFRPKKSV